uniref:Uncharacterized protein n=1 Tax=Astatotilapia calliptera TaxID=8154 RepID=A0AAX7TVS7_ASTCA
MSPTVLLLLSLLTAPCGGCEFDLEGVKNIKGTIDSSSAGFCCVFPAAYVLHDSWQVLLTNLWEEHLNHSLVVELTRTLDKIISKNRNMEVLAVSNMTLLVRFVVLIILISLPCFLAADVSGGDRLIPVLLGVFLSRRTPKDYSPSRARLLTTRAVDNMKSGRIIDTPPLSSGVPPSYSAFVWSSLLLRLYWCLLP